MGRRQKQQEEEIEDLDGDEEIIDQGESEESEGAGETVAEEDAGTETEEGLEGEFSEAIGDDVLDEYDDSDVDLKVVDEVLSHKDQNARALAIRRAIEERLEAKRLSRDLDYLDLDLED
jgi:hypothetical protein